MNDVSLRLHCAQNIVHHIHGMEERCNKIVCASNIDIDEPHKQTAAAAAAAAKLRQYGKIVHTTNINYRFSIQLSLFGYLKMPPVFYYICLVLFEAHQICVYLRI